MHPAGGGAISMLNVAEILSRPSGGMRSREGRSRYNRVFEFDYAIGGRARHTLVTSVTGHLMELEFDDRFRRWHSCDPADLFHSPVRKVVPQKNYLDVYRFDSWGGALLPTYTIGQQKHAQALDHHSQDNAA